MAKMTMQETYRRLRALGFSAEQAIMELDGMGEPVNMDESEPEPVKPRRTVSVPAVAANHFRKGPRVEYAAKRVRKGQSIQIAAGNNTAVWDALNRYGAMTVPDIARRSKVSPKSVESSVYQLYHAGLLERRPVER